MPRSTRPQPPLTPAPPPATTRSALDDRHAPPQRSLQQPGALCCHPWMQPHLRSPTRIILPAGPGRIHRRRGTATFRRRLSHPAPCAPVAARDPAAPNPRPTQRPARRRSAARTIRTADRQPVPRSRNLPSALLPPAAHLLSPSPRRPDRTAHLPAALSRGLPSPSRPQPFTRLTVAARKPPPRTHSRPTAQGPIATARDRVSGTKSAERTPIRHSRTTDSPLFIPSSC